MVQRSRPLIILLRALHYLLKRIMIYMFILKKVPAQLSLKPFWEFPGIVKL